MYRTPWASKCLQLPQTWSLPRTLLRTRNGQKHPSPIKTSLRCAFFWLVVSLFSSIRWSISSASILFASSQPLTSPMALWRRSSVCGQSSFSGSVQAPFASCLFHMFLRQKICEVVHVKGFDLLKGHLESLGGHFIQSNCVKGSSSLY